jgi:hypothetical protein
MVAEKKEQRTDRRFPGGGARRPAAGAGGRGACLVRGVGVKPPFTTRSAPHRLGLGPSSRRLIDGCGNPFHRPVHRLRRKWHPRGPRAQHFSISPESKSRSLPGVRPVCNSCVDRGFRGDIFNLFARGRWTVPKRGNEEIQRGEATFECRESRSRITSPSSTP